MIANSLALAEKGWIDPTFLFSFALGELGALPAWPKSLLFLSETVPNHRRAEFDPTRSVAEISGDRDGNRPTGRDHRTLGKPTRSYRAQRRTVTSQE
jgi:hypothetical protein